MSTHNLPQPQWWKLEGFYSFWAWDCWVRVCCCGIDKKHHFCDSSSLAFRQFIQKNVGDSSSAAPVPAPAASSAYEPQQPALGVFPVSWRRGIGWVIGEGSENEFIFYSFFLCTKPFFVLVGLVMFFNWMNLDLNNGCGHFGSRFSPFAFQRF